MPSPADVANAVRTRISACGYSEEADGLVVRDTYRHAQSMIYVSMPVSAAADAEPVAFYASSKDDPDDIVAAFIEAVHAEEDWLRTEAEERARELHERAISFMTDRGDVGDVRLLQPEPWQHDSTFVRGGSLVTSVRVRARTAAGYDKAEVATPLTELPPRALRALKAAAADLAAEADSVLKSLTSVLASVSEELAR
jgi:hypothetical protein